MPHPSRRRSLAVFVALAAALAAVLPSRHAWAAREPEYAARQILVAHKGAQGSEVARTKEEAKALAERVATEAKKPGSDFAALSKAHNDDKYADAWGGLVGIFEPSMRALEPECQAALEAMKDGEVSGPIETAAGFHVLQRVAVADAKAQIDRLTVVFSSVRVPFASGTGRTKEQALADATRVAAALRAGTAIGALDPALRAEPISRGMPDRFYRGRSQMSAGLEPLEKALLALAPDAVSDPVEIKDAWWVLKRVPWFHVRVSHLIVQWKGAERAPSSTTRTKEEAKARAAEALAKVRADPGAWGRVVAEYSEEPAAAEREGYLGVGEPGAWVPEFEQAVGKIPPGGLSELVETSFGWHVLLRHD
jgi:parvulin-like peptidyl-prolyl isomerase